MLQSNHDGASGREAQRAEGERSAAATGSSAPNGGSDPELVDRPTRRRFSAEYKLDILHRADGCNALGEIGALLRSEGLYSSHLATWRKQREAGFLAALSVPRGRKAPDPLVAENAKLLRRAERAESDLAKARKVIEIQGNVLALSEQLLSTEDAGHSGSTAR